MSLATDAPLRPAPIRTDGSNPFARHSMQVRVPDLLRETARRNADYPPAIGDALHRLADDLAHDAPLRMLRLPAPDYDVWAARFAPHAGDTWLGASWFFAEMLAYRLAMQAARYWDTLRDPFRPFKDDELASDALWEVLALAQNAEGNREERLATCLTYAVWGNRMDQSVQQSADRGTAASDEHLLTNHIADVVAALVRDAPGDLHIVMDNAGTEQALDYALVDLLLTDDLASSVTLHVKMLPVLVSDVIVADVHRMLDHMNDRGGDPAALAARLRAALDAGRLRVVPDAFWNTDGRLWELPPRLEQTFTGARLVVLKGDANYRRATNDAVWPRDARLADALPRFPAPLLALRVLKSDTLVDVDPARQAALDAAEPDWRTAGAYGVAQFLPQH